MTTRRLSFEVARIAYVHRFTMQHAPAWASKQNPDGRYPAPHYRSDREWYDNTLFPGEGDLPKRATYCHSRNQTWPLGKSLDAPFKPGLRVVA